MFVVLFSFSKSNSLRVKNARQELFMTNNCPLENLPQTKGALQKHSLRFPNWMHLVISIRP